MSLHTAESGSIRDNQDFGMASHQISTGSFMSTKPTAEDDSPFYLHHSNNLDACLI